MVCIYTIILIQMAILWRTLVLCLYIVTGDLNIIKDVKLRNLIKKGPTYREQNNKYRLGSE